MRINLIGATGYVGSRILQEALHRGHAVTAWSRTPGRLTPHPALNEGLADLGRPETLAAIFADGGTVVSAYNPGGPTGPVGYANLIAAQANRTSRLVVVGGAGSLEVAPGRRLVDEPDFPEAWRTGALATAAVLERLRQTPDLDWTFISPAASLSPGERTGVYRTGGDVLLRDADGASRISVEDLAVALIDEVETPRHRRTRFSVAY